MKLENLLECAASMLLDTLLLFFDPHAAHSPLFSPLSSSLGEWPWGKCGQSFAAVGVHQHKAATKTTWPRRTTTCNVVKICVVCCLHAYLLN